jgi:hypothetical protein
MSNMNLIEKMAASIEEVPETADVIALRQYSLDEIEQRAKRLLSTTAESCNLSLDRGDWSVQQDQTLIRLPMGARAGIYHASGAMYFTSGLQPMESLFRKVEDPKALTKKMEKFAGRLNIHQWTGNKQSLEFERLWQIKAAAAEPNGKATEPVLCRVVGAYRHFVNGLPVLGPASLAIKLAEEGALDSLSFQMREPTGEVIDRPETLRPEQAARQIYLQLEMLMGRTKAALHEIAQPEWMRFGYLSLPKRKTQQVLAPVYLSAITILGQEHAQAYLFVTSATEKQYLPICLSGNEAYPRATRSTGNGRYTKKIGAEFREVAA